jgi:uncharacterized protein (DUF3084 family)
MIDPAVIETAIAKLKAVQPHAAKLADVDAILVKLATANHQLRVAKDALTAVAAEKEKLHADIAASKAELSVLQGGLAQAHKEYDALTRELKKMKG